PRLPSANGITRVAIAPHPRGSLFAIRAGIRARARHQTILRIDDVALPVDAKALREGAFALCLAPLAADGFARELSLGLRRGGSKRAPGCHMRPHRLHNGLEDRHGNAAPGRSTAQGAPLAVRIVVSDPHRGSDIIAEADEPGVVLVVRSAGLAGHIGREM